jgi:hypothetical protein
VSGVGYGGENENIGQKMPRMRLKSKSGIWLL